MIYTIGDRTLYDPLFDEGAPSIQGLTSTSEGGMVFITYEEAEEHCPHGYTVYGVDADWYNDTTPSPGDPWNTLIVTSKLIKLL